MKNKKLVISIVTGLLVIGAGIGLSSINNKPVDDDYEVATVDADSIDGKEIKVSEYEEIEEEETPEGELVLGGKTSVRNVDSKELNIIRDRLFAHVNEERKTGAANKLLVKNEKLEATGNARAKEVVSVWSHTRPNNTSWETILPVYGISTTNLKAGEDLAKITFTAKSTYSEASLDEYADIMHETLMNSTTHRTVMLNQAYSELGVGIYAELKDGKVTVYAVEHYKNATAEQKAASTLTIKDAPTTAVYTGKQIKPAISVYEGSKKLTADKDYTVSYGANVNPGAATIKVAGKGNYNGSKTVTFYIVPKAPTSLKLTAASKGFKVSYAKATGASGYEIAYSTSKTSGFKTVSTTDASKTISGLTAKKTYYVKVRAYKTVDGQKHYGAYSAVSSVKTK